MVERPRCGVKKKDGGACRGYALHEPDADGVNRCRAHSTQANLQGEQREKRKLERRVHRARKAARLRGEKVPTGQPKADELEAARAAGPVDVPGAPQDVAAWIYRQPQQSDPDSWPTPKTHAELIDARHRAAIALARGWLTDTESKALHQHLTGMMQSLPKPADIEGKDRRGATVLFQTIRSREDAARLEVESELEGAVV